MKKKLAATPSEDRVLAALESDLQRYERWMLVTLDGEGYTLHFSVGKSWERPTYAEDDLKEVVYGVLIDPDASLNANAAAKAAFLLPWMRTELARGRYSARLVQAFSNLSAVVPPQGTEKRLRARAAKNAGKQRGRNSRQRQVLNTGAQNYAELRQRAPELVEKYPKENLMQDISKAKAKRAKQQLP